MKIFWIFNTFHLMGLVCDLYTSINDYTLFFIKYNYPYSRIHGNSFPFT